MVEGITVARPYARAIFSQASLEHTLTEWQSVLTVFAEVVEILSARQMIGDPQVSDEMLSSLCFDLIAQVVELKDSLQAELKRLIALLLSEQRFNIVPDIAALYHQLLIDHEGIVAVQVVSPSPLTAEEKQRLIPALEQRFQSKVTVDYDEDPALIGGLMIRSGDFVFDGTIRSKLDRLAERII